MEEDFLDPDYFVPYIRPERLSPEAFQRISELSKLGIPRHFLRKYVKRHFHATISKAQLRNFKEGLYKTPTSPFLESSDASDVEEIMDMEEWPSEKVPAAEIQSSSVETHDVGQDKVRTSNDAERISNITDEALADALDRASREQLTRLAAPRLESKLSLWELLMLHSKAGGTPDAITTLFLVEFLAFVKEVQDFLQRQLDHIDVESPSASAHDSLWRKHQTTPACAEVGIDKSLPPSRMQKTQCRPRSAHNSVRGEGSVSSTAQTNSVITVTGGLVKIETPEQVAILGLPRGKYRMRLPPDFEKSHRTPPPTGSQTGFPSTSQQPASPLPPDITGSEVCVSSRSPVGGVGRSTPTTPLPLPSGPSLSTESKTAKNPLPLSESFAPSTPPTVDHPLTSAQPTPQIDTASQAASRRSTVFKHRFCLLPGLKKPLEIPSSKTGKTSPTNSQSVPIVPSDASTPLDHLEFEEPSFGGVMTSGPIDPPLSPSQSTSEQYTAEVSEPSAWDPPTSDPPASHPTTQSSLSDGDLVGPIPDEWISSGRFQPLTMDSGSPSQLILEPASGGVFHRTTGRLVFRVPPGSSSLQLSPPSSTSNSTIPSSDVNKVPIDTTTAAAAAAAVTSAPSTPSPVVDSPIVTAAKDSTTAPPTSSPERPHKRRCTTNSLSSGASNNPAPPPTNLESLNRPILQIERISGSHVVVTRVDGVRFMVEDGGSGLTQATMEKILRLSA
ncbi:hypothetical protein SprV_0301078200 [Sparganum proliferum]